MIYSQAFRDEQFSPAVALFSAAGLIRTTAGIHHKNSKSLSKEPFQLFFILSTNVLKFFYCLNLGGAIFLLHSINQKQIVGLVVVGVYLLLKICCIWPNFFKLCNVELLE